jgi:hypothetical protein
MASSSKRWLTPDQERIVRAAYAKGATSAEAAFLACITVSVLQARLRDQIADLRRGRGNGGRRGAAVDPTPEEIDARRAEVDERRRRLMGAKLCERGDLS